MQRWIGLCFGASMIVLMASVLGSIVTLFDAVEWQPFFVKSFLGALVLVVGFGLTERLSSLE